MNAIPPLVKSKSGSPTISYFPHHQWGFIYILSNVSLELFYSLHLALVFALKLGHSTVGFPFYVAVL